MVTDAGAVAVPLALDPAETPSPPPAPVSDLPAATDPVSCSPGGHGANGHGQPPATHRHGGHAPPAVPSMTPTAKPPPKPAASSGYELFEYRPRAVSAGPADFAQQLLTIAGEFQPASV